MATAGDRYVTGDRYKGPPQISGVFEATAGAPQDIRSAPQEGEKSVAPKAFFKDKIVPDDEEKVIKTSLTTNPGKDVIETPAARTNRLIAEVREMKDFVIDYLRKHGITDPSIATSAEVAEECNKFLGGDFRDMLNELEQLELSLNQTIESPQYKALTLIEQDDGGGEESGAAPAAPAVRNRPKLYLTPEKVELLMSQLRTTPPDKSNELTFEIYSSPMSSSSFDSARLFELERRLADLEEALGIQQLPQLALPAPSVCETLKLLVTRLSALHPTKLDKIARRVSSLTSQVDELLLRRSKLIGKEQSHESLPGEFKKVNELSGLLEQTKPAAAALPTILARLKALRSLHQESAALVSRLDALETQQEELAKTVSSLEGTLDRVRETVAQSLNLYNE